MILYGILGSVLGIALAFGLLQGISKLLIASLTRGSEVSVNVTVLCISLGVSLLTATLAGFLPAVRLSGASANLALRSGGRGGLARDQHWLRGWFAVTQIALALLLLVTAGTFFQALAGLRNRDLGFNPDHTSTVDIELSSGTYEASRHWLLYSR